jgi:hypothetical protein
LAECFIRVDTERVVDSGEMWCTERLVGPWRVW